MITNAAHVYRNAEPGDDGSSPVEPIVDTPVDTTPDPASAAPVTPPVDKTAAMMNAMFPKAEADQSPEAVAQRARDEAGRFAKKPVEAVQPQAKPGDPAKPPVKPAEKPDALTAMPEGLTPKAQERFQALANTNKELSSKVQEYEPIVQSALGLQETFREHGVKREQFDQAMQVVGLMNRGDLEGAQRALEQQLRLISLHTGKPIGAVDALAEHPDLRDRVNNLQLTEADAIELARGRMVNGARQQQETQQREVQQRETQEQQAHDQGVLAVDKFCKDKMATDLDYARIEPILQKQIGALLKGVHPSRYAAIVEKTYDMIKETAGMTRTAAPSTSVLRPTGGASPASKPASMYESMWGTKAPA